MIKINIKMKMINNKFTVLLKISIKIKKKI